MEQRTILKNSEKQNRNILISKQKAAEPVLSFQQQFESSYTWYAGFQRNVMRFGKKPALIDPKFGKTWTYVELQQECNRLVQALQCAGVQKGERLMVQLHNCPEFVFAYLACHAAGFVFCPINFRLAAGELAACVDSSRPAVLLSEPEQHSTVQQALQLTANAPKIHLETGASYAEFVAGGRKSSKFVSSGFAYTETLQLFTSGTTGKPKQVSLTSLQEVLSAHDVMMQLPLSAEDRTMNTTPWFHRGGIHAGGITPTLYAGGTVVVQRQFDAGATLDAIEQEHLTYVIGVPNVLELLSEEQLRQPRDLSGLHGIVTMGSPLEKQACIRYQEILTPRIFNGYGTTETFWNTLLRPEDLPEHAGSAGQACPEDDVRVVRIYSDRLANPEELAETDGKEIGEVIIQSCAKAASRYAGQTEETHARFRNGFFYTNDLATWDENHYLRIVGRKDDMILSGGENIYPVEVEEVLHQHPLVADCLVTSVPDRKRGERVIAYIVPRTDALTAKELDDYCRNSPYLANYKRPRDYQFVAQLPRNATGKVLRRTIQQQIESIGIAQK